jgi:hypothetical protein
MFKTPLPPTDVPDIPDLPSSASFSGPCKTSQAFPSISLTHSECHQPDFYDNSVRRVSGQVSRFPSPFPASPERSRISPPITPQAYQPRPRSLRQSSRGVQQVHACARGSSEAEAPRSLPRTEIFDRTLRQQPEQPICFLEHAPRSGLCSLGTRDSPFARGQPMTQKCVFLHAFHSLPQACPSLGPLLARDTGKLSDDPEMRVSTCVSYFLVRANGVP